jgi:hypothetical protein
MRVSRWDTRGKEAANTSAATAVKVRQQRMVTRGIHRKFLQNGSIVGRINASVMRQWLDLAVQTALL